MAIVVVGAGGRGAGKTALICGMIQAIPERSWVVVKVTSDDHGKPSPIWEDREASFDAEKGSDTARYLAAGARRALLVAANEAELGPLVQQILDDCSAQDCVLFESNSVLRFLRPDVCLAVASSLKGERKPSFELVEQCMDATVAPGGHNHMIDGVRPHFHLASLGRVSPTMAEWLRERLDKTNC